ncbi:MAG: site-2 protease family protein [Candidatus Odinarchaeum yellowstonii]|uniref:Site-2 protease family protein n=1 Tax=Odinarchaeota yellowstonii (strain LCB_4) TaxID=1841599 RepID=A0AAF0D2Y0_ODILC|nr:MAG: site-2 protease family protein [Candidatus Odinarchaeum yellowstonii]
MDLNAEVSKLLYDILANPLIILLFFWLILFLISQLFHVERWGVQISPFLLMFKTKRANRFIAKIARRYPRAWVAVWSLGASVSLIVIVFVLYFLTSNLIKLFYRSPEASPLIPIVPGITITGFTLIYIIIPLFLVVLFHEFAHGVAAHVNNIPVRAAGLFLAIFFPGAFVEPDNRRLNESSGKAKLMVYAAGSFSNLGLAVIGLLLINSTVFNIVISPLYSFPSGVIFQETVSGSPISAYIVPPFILTGASINGSSHIYPINSISDFLNFMDLTNPYTNVTLYTDKGVYTIPLDENPGNPGKGYLGVVLTTAFPYYPPKPWAEWLGPLLPYHLYQVFNWLWIISFSVGIFNLLPIPIFDGDKIVAVLLDRFISSEKTVQIRGRRLPIKKILLYVIRVFSILILALNILFSFIIFPVLF